MKRMNYRYLFRGKRVDTGEWVIGQLSGFVIAECSKGVWTNNVLSCLAYEVEPDSIGQCTGLRYENGDFIFEGDIIEFNGNKGIIKWSYDEHDTWGFQCGFILDWKYGCMMRKDLCYWALIRNKDIAIIGNLHDNPELFKGSEPE